MQKKYDLITSQKKHKFNTSKLEPLFSKDLAKRMLTKEYKTLTVKTYDYEFKIFAGDMLVFNALITQDTSNFLIAPVPEIGIDESFKDIFTRIIKGEFRLNYIEKSDFEAFELKTQELVINEGSAYANLKKFETICEQYLYVRSEVIPTTFHEILKFRFDGPHYHLGYGVPYKEAGTLEELSNDLVDTVINNVDGFNVVLQTQKEAASTAIPYMSQTYNASALDVVKQCIRDINAGRIDTDFIASGTKYSNIYKNFIERLAGVAKLKDLEVFEVFVLGTQIPVNK